MGKSYKKYPITGYASDTDKPYKKQSNRRSRKNINQRLREAVFFEDNLDISADEFDYDEDYGNPNFSMKDGKSKALLNPDWEPQYWSKYYNKKDELIDKTLRK